MARNWPGTSFSSLNFSENISKFYSRCYPLIDQMTTYKKNHASIIYFTAGGIFLLAILQLSCQLRAAHEGTNVPLCITTILTDSSPSAF